MVLRMGVLSIVLLAASTAAAQPSFTAATDVISEDFAGFRGQGYSPAPDPADGKLDSNAWRVLGIRPGDTDFGETADTGRYAFGPSDGAETGGGIYAFDVDDVPVAGTHDYALGVQPTGDDFTPGSHQLRIRNDTGSAITALAVSYTIHYRNDQGRSNRLDLRIIRASDDAEVAVAALDFATPEAAETGIAHWVEVGRDGTVDLSSMPIADGDYLILSWDSHDASGSGSRDEIAIDDISVSLPPCGNGVLDSAEVCDDGNVVTETECPYGSMSCTACRADCGEELTLSGRYCGDGTTDSGDGEACDDGNTVTETECDYGTLTCTACDAACAEITLSGRHCGDGTTDSGDGEVCDDGNTVTETECEYGTATCTACNDACGTELSLSGRYCGDGTVDASDGEECDDGNTDDGDGCSASCTMEAEVDAGVPDAGTDEDAGVPDAGTDEDAGVTVDAGPEQDAGAEPDASTETDGGEVPIDGGTSRRADDGCSCSAPGMAGAEPAMALLVLLGLVGFVRRRQR